MIRPATRLDTQEIAALFEASIGGRQDQAQISAWIDSAHAAVLIDVIDDAVRGALAGRLVETEAEIYDLAVHEACRRRGIGAALVHAFREQCRVQGIQNIFLEVRESNEPAIKLYRSLNFSPRGARTAYYADGETALILGWTEQ